MCTEDSPSGLWRTLGKRVGCKPSGVRIPHPPPLVPEPIEVPVFLLLVVPPDLRPPRVLPAREPSAPRASLCASSRSPARPRRPRGGLQSGGACRCEWPGPVAAREIATRELRSEWSISKPGQALPPPPGLADGLATRPARPCRRPRDYLFRPARGLPARSPPRRERRSACRLEAWPGPAGPAPTSCGEPSCRLRNRAGGRLISKPGQALPPSPGLAVGPVWA